MKKDRRYRWSMWLIALVGGVLMAACQSEELAANLNEELMADGNGQGADAGADVRQLVEHVVSVALENSGANQPSQSSDASQNSTANQPSTRVGYTADGDGLQLSWEANETLGVYIQKTNGSLIYAGTVSGSGEAGSRGERRFSGTVSEKQNGETYVYVHPAMAEGEMATAAQGHIDYSNNEGNAQQGELSSTAHITRFIPLVWHEGNAQVENHGYAVHLRMTFNEDPGKITSVTLQTMTGAGNDAIFPVRFDVSNLAASSTMTGSARLTVTGDGTATNNDDGTWTADAYIACTHHDVDVFRTKFDVKVETESNGTFYNEFRSFPGQQQATSITGLPMLANGKCYNMTTKLSKSVSYTVINDQYKVFSVLGMWNQFGKPYDPFGLIVYDGVNAEMPSTVPAQIKNNRTAIQTRYQNKGAGTPTWLGAGPGTLYDMTAASNSNNTKQEDVTINNITIIDSPTEVFVTFISEYGWNENLLGYYHYTGEAPETSFNVRKTLIFPNFSKPNHQPFNLGGAGAGDNTSRYNIGRPEDAPLREFETVKLVYTDANGYSSTTFPAGTTIGFMMMIDSEANAESVKPQGYDLLKWSQWRLFTNTTWNKENTIANGAAANWPTSPGYTRWNYFCSGDVCSDDGGTPIPGLAIYGVKDTGNNDVNTAYGAMIFMVSTSVPEAMQTQNTHCFNIGTGSVVVAKQ